METSLPKKNEFTTHQQARVSGHELLRRNVVEAASHLLVEEGPEALKVRRVARALNSSTKIIYTLFEGKDGLANALYLEGCTRLGEAVAVVPGGATPQEYVQGIATAYWTFAMTSPNYYSVLFGGAIPGFQPGPTSKQMLVVAVTTMAGKLETYMAQGMLPVQDPRVLTRALWAPMHGVISLYLLGHFPSVEEAKQAYDNTVQALIRML